jgi:hypothetical protein
MSLHRQKEIIFWLLLGGGAVFVVVIVLKAPEITQWLFGYAKPQTAPDFGELYGWVAALFSGLAFVGVIAAMVLQKQELELQRQELAETRQELRGQKKQLEAQNKTLQQQTFENTFFQLLRLHNDIVESLSLAATPQVTYTGRDCFRYLYHQFRDMYLNIEPRAAQGQKVIQQINRKYLDFHKQWQVSVGHYFRNLYNILKFISRSDVKESTVYSNLVRAAQLSTFELLLLFYSCLSDLGREKFKPLIEGFGMLEGIAKDQLASADDIKLYQPRAFGNL